MKVFTIDIFVDFFAIGILLPPRGSFVIVIF